MGKSTLTKRIIPCLDIKNGRTVKGVNFVSLRDAGDPIELAEQYAAAGADELVFLDISATQEERTTLYDLVSQVAAKVNIPFTVGGGISEVGQVAHILRNGADKVSVNSAVVRRPELALEIAQEFGSQCLTVAIDARFISGQWLVHTHGGTRATDITLQAWVLKMEDSGAGEILFTSMDHDGTKAGFANDALSELYNLVHIPIIASGGAGSMEDFKNVFEKGRAAAALAASVFHFGEIGIPELKKYLQQNNIAVRLLPN